MTLTTSRVLVCGMIVGVGALLALAIVRENGKQPAKPFVAVGHGNTWSDTTAARVKMFTAGEGGDSLAAAIQQIVRPSKEDVRPILRDVRVRKIGADRIKVDLDIACDVAQGAERIQVSWEFDKYHHIGARVAPVGGDIGRLDEYLRDNVYPLLR